MRYFFFTYSVMLTDKVGIGNVWTDAERFPSSNSIKEIAANNNDGCSLDKIVVTGWQEFSSKEDFDNFNS